MAATDQALTGFTGVRVRRLHNMIKAHWADWFADVAPGLTPAQGGALLLIGENPGIGQRDLADLLRIEAPSLSQILRPLLDRGLVLRRSGARDRRAVAFTLSERGRAMVETILREGPRHEDRVLGTLTTEERAELLRLLDKALGEAGDMAMRRSA